MFIVVITGISTLLYMIFMPVYYEYVKDKQIVQAYQDIGELDLSDLNEKDYVMFANYENENLSFCIADEDMKPIYLTESSDNKENTVHRSIAKRLDSFSRTPEVIRNSGKLLETARYRGIIKQDETDYYILIKDIAAGRKSITMAEKFYMALFFLLMLPGSIFMTLMWKYLLKPVDKLVSATDALVNGNYQTELQTEGRYRELNQLAKNLNQIAQQMQSHYLFHIHGFLKHILHLMFHYGIFQKAADHIRHFCHFFLNRFHIVFLIFFEVSEQFCLTGNYGKRSFQFMGNICNKFFSPLFNLILTDIVVKHLPFIFFQQF